VTSLLLDKNLGRLFAPRSVAVIGASDDPTRIGGRPIAYMRRFGFAGTIAPVNPNRTHVQGLKAYASVAELPEAPDVAIVAVPANSAIDVVQDLALRGTAGAIVFSSGFAETGNEGAAAQRRMVTAAGAHGMRVIGPNSIGVLNTHNGFYGTFMSGLDMRLLDRGRIGIASQSGAYGGHIVAIANARRIGFSVCAMTGNEADVSVSDIIAWMVEDAHTDVIAVYAEGIKDADGLIAALDAARSARKPVVMMKVGRSKVGSMAAQSHTASIAGNDAVIDAVLKEFGVIRAQSTEHMLDVAHLATRRIYPVGNTLGVLTLSGGAGVIISDVAEALGLPMPEMPQDAQQRLKELVPFSAPRNPVDATAQVLNDMSLVGRFAEATVAEGNYKSIFGFLSYAAGTDISGPQMLKQMSVVRAKHPDRLYVLSVVGTPERVQEYEQAGFTVFEDPTRAVTAIHAMGRLGEAFARSDGLAPPEVANVELPQATPSEHEAKRLLSAAGIACVSEQAVTSANAAVEAAEALGYPVVLKILSPDILHKSDIGGVLLDIADAPHVRTGYAMLIDRARQAARNARIEGVLVAKQLEGGVECIVGIHRDPAFGPVAMFGLGGVFVEVLKDVVFRRCPFGIDVAEEMIRSVRGAPLLLGARGRRESDLPALARMLATLSAYAHRAGPRLKSIDLNPVLAMPAGQGAYAADAVIEIS
jgi:acyl-CoA synthetase (NDP forming)